MSDSFRNSFIQLNVPQSDQPNNLFLNAMGINTPISRKRSFDSTSTHAIKFNFGQTQAASSQVPPFVNALENLQKSKHIFPNVFEKSPVLLENIPLPSVAPSSICSTPSQQLPKSNGPTVQIDRAKIDSLKQEIKKLESLKSSELELTRSLLFEEVNKLENNVNPSWLDIKNKLYEANIVKYVFLPYRNDINMAYLFGANNDTMKQIREKYCCEIDLCGAGSSSNRLQEVQLLATGNPIYQHFAWPLHLKICIKAPVLLSYERFWKILNLVYRILQTNEPFNWDGIQVSAYFPNQSQFGMNQFYQKLQQRK